MAFAQLGQVDPNRLWDFYQRAMLLPQQQITANRDLQRDIQQQGGPPTQEQSEDLRQWRLLMQHQGAAPWAQTVGQFAAPGSVPGLTLNSMPVEGDNPA